MTYTGETVRAHLVKRYYIGHMGDGYDQMQELADDYWHARAAWGLRGWNLGQWPYVAFYFRKSDPTRFRVVTEGDVDEYAGFTDEADRDSAVDYLFAWWAKNDDQPWAREWDLDNLPPEACGPFSWERLDAEAA